MDGLPETLPGLPPDIVSTPASSRSHESESPTDFNIKNPDHLRVESPPNSYGLFRHYYVPSFPLHDPDSELTMDDFCDIPSCNSAFPETSEAIDHVVYAPYPNKSSFLLGEWNWNDHVQKSKSNFKSLIDIVSDPSFDPSDIRDTQWEAIDAELGSSDIAGDEPHWIKNDASWSKTPITIPVPFHRYTINPGPRDYTVANFYHRSIISVLRETLCDPLEGLHFHYEPYELYWKRNREANPIRVFGELYTSPAFVDAHRALQDSPPEPGCSLPRLVAGLMLASDSTQLTSFGDAKIWPQYLYFGNHSKYQRCKPSRHLCHHIAYFHRVRYLSLNLLETVPG